VLGVRRSAADCGSDAGSRLTSNRALGWLFCNVCSWVSAQYRGSYEQHRLAMIAMVEAETERESRTAHERRYYLCSAKLDAATFEGHAGPRVTGRCLAPWIV